MITIVGVVADALGAAVQWVGVPVNGRNRNFDVKREFTSTPSTEYRSVQGTEIAVDVDHGSKIGAVKYLERSERRLYAVCEIDGLGLEGPLYFSPEIRHYGGRDIELRGLAITHQPASIALGPIDAYAGTLREAASRIVYEDGWQGEAIRRAAAYDRARKYGEPLVIQGVHARRRAPKLARASTGQRIETRSATALGVRRARRELDLIIAPAETPTVIYERGKRYTKVFSHGAFSGCEKDPGRVRVNRDHVRERVIGRALRLDPWDEQGLTGTVKLARVRDADDALALIDDGLLAVSAGFAVANGGDERHGTHRRVRRATLDHIALVPEPAYESATITAIRTNTPGRTNLDRARELLLAVHG